MLWWWLRHDDLGLRLHPRCIDHEAMLGQTDLIPGLQRQFLRDDAVDPQRMTLGRLGDFQQQLAVLPENAQGGDVALWQLQRAAALWAKLKTLLKRQHSAGKRACDGT